jgi:hypothetical protein
MKITSDTSDLLIVDDRPLFIGIMLGLFILVFVGIGMAITLSGVWAGLIFVVFGGGLGLTAFALFVRRVQVVFHRPEAWVELRRRSLFGSRTIRHPLDVISRAELESTRNSDGSTLYRVALVIEEGQSAGRHPITEAYSSGSRHQQICETINRWLEIGADAQDVANS